MLQTRETCKKTLKQSMDTRRGRQYTLLEGYSMRMAERRDAYGEGEAYERPIGHNYNYLPYPGGIEGQI